ncbi:MAG: O-antigen ligase family protein [Actinomycetota bacterium]|nr:O-antigen ligase family protein [Actinomycetota bacterium]
MLWIGLLAPIGLNQARSTTDVLASPISTLSIFQAVVPAACLILAFLLARPRLFPVTRIESWLLLFLGISVLSTVWSIQPFPTFLKAVAFIAAYILVLLLIRLHGRAGVDSISALGTVVHYLLLTVPLGLLVSASRAFAPISSLNPVHRLKGVIPYIHPDALGFLVACGIVLLLARIGPDWTKRVGARYALFGLYIGMILETRSRSSLVICIVGVLALMMQRLNRRLSLIVVAPAALLLIILVFDTSSSTIVTSYVQRGQSSTAFTSLSGRTVSWHAAVSLWKQAPLLGQGYYSGTRLGNLEDILNRSTSNTGSVWVDVLLNLGLLGLIPFAFFVFSGARAALDRGGGQSAPVTARRALIAMCLASSLVIVSLEQPGYSMIIFSIVLLARRSREESQPVRDEDLYRSEPSLRPSDGAGAQVGRG